MWFGKDAGLHGLPEVTLERCEASFERHGWEYERQEETLTALFNDLRVAVQLMETPEFPGVNFLRVTTWSGVNPADKDNFPALLEWAEDWNRRTVVGTARPEFTDEDGGDVNLRVDVSFLCKSGLSDAQLDECLFMGIAHSVGAIETYVQESTAEDRQTT